MSEPRLRVTWLCLEWPRMGQHSGGVGRYVFRLAERMRELVDLTVVVFDDAVPMDGVARVALPAPRSRVDRFYLSPARARRLVARTAPDLVHAHGDDWLLDHRTPRVRSFYGSALGEARSSSGLRKANHLVLAATEWLAGRRSDVRLGIAPESVDLFACQHVFPPFMGTPDVPVVPADPARGPHVVFIGSFQGRKRGRLVQAAVAAVNASRSEPVALSVVGPADDAASWDPWVDHRSGLDDREVDQLLTSAWLLAAPSEYEGFGIPVVEALAHGVRVVASDNPGTHYLRGLVAEATVEPLMICADDQLADTIGARLAAGASMSPAERAVADTIVGTMTELGSPQRLLEVYREAIACR